jgi:hypothetical protein
MKWFGRTEACCGSSLRTKSLFGVRKSGGSEGFHVGFGSGWVPWFPLRSLWRQRFENYGGSQCHDSRFVFPDSASIRQEQNSNHHKTASCQEDPGSIFAWPNKTRPEHIDAIRILNNHKMLPPDARKEIKILFDDYMKDIEDRRLVNLSGSTYAGDCG